MKICGPCEIAHIKTKATRFHIIEPLLKINLVHRSIPKFAKPSAGGGNTSAPEKPKSPTWVENMFRVQDDPQLVENSLEGKSTILTQLCILLNALLIRTCS